MSADPQTKQQTLLAESRPGMAALVAIGLFFAGGAIGAGLAAWLAPGSGVAAMTSFLALPAAFMLSLVLWQGLTAVIMLFRLLLRRRAREASGTATALSQLARKAWVLVPLPMMFLGAAGLISGALGDTAFFVTLFVYIFSGGVYGLICYYLGRTGRLPLLED